MRRSAILIVAAGLWAVGASTAAAQLPQVPLPDVPVPQVPDVDPPEVPGGGGGGGGGGPVPSVETPSTGGNGDGGGGSGGGGLGGGGSGGGGNGGSGSGGGSGSDSCPCAAPASGYPVVGDYDCPVEDGEHGAASGDEEAGLVASRSDGLSDGGAGGAAEGVLGAGAFGEDTSQPPTADGELLGEDSATSLFVGALFALAGLGLLVGIAGGLRRAFRDRQGYP
jgi:hypothetical protein